MIKALKQVNRERLAQLPIKKFASVFALDISSKAIPYLLAGFYAANMPKEEFGLYSYVFLIAMMVGPQLTLGQESAFTKLHFDERISRPLLIGNQLLVVAILPTLVCILLALGILDVPVDALISEWKLDKTMIALVVGMILGQTALTWTLTYYLVTSNQTRYQVLNFLRVFGIHVVSIIGLLAFGFASAEYRMAVEVPFSLLIAAIAFWPVIQLAEFKIDWSLIKRSFAISFPIWVTGLASLTYGLADKYYLQRFFGAEQLADYAFATFMTLPINLLYTSFNILWIPKFFGSERGGQLGRRSIQAFAWLTLALLLVSLGIWGILLGLRWGGSDTLVSYSMALAVFPVLALAKSLEVGTGVFQNFTVLYEKTYFNIVITVILATVAIVLGLIIIPKYGIWGATLLALLLAMLRLGSYAYLVQNLHAKQKLKLTND